MLLESLLQLAERFRAHAVELFQCRGRYTRKLVQLGIASRGERSKCWGWNAFRECAVRRWEVRCRFATLRHGIRIATGTASEMAANPRPAPDRDG